MGSGESKNKQTKIFISHSSKDAKYVEAFVDLLEFIGIQKDQLFCSSISGYDIPIDQDIYSYLFDQFYNYDLHMFYMLSQNYYNSPAALNEMGAAWVLKSNYTTILLPGFEYQEITGAVNPDQISVKLDEDRSKLKNQLDQMRSNLGKEFDLSDRPKVRWDGKLDEFIDKINEITKEILNSNEQGNDVQEHKDAKSVRKPELTIHIDKDWIIPYKEVNNIDEEKIKDDYKALTMEDVILSNVSVTQEELDKYNSSLPSKDEIETYIKDYREYLMETTCHTKISFSVENSGNCKANNVYIMLRFPPEICVLEEDEIDDIPEPQRPEKPNDPIKEAQVREMKSLTNGFVDILEKARPPFEYDIANLSPTINTSFICDDSYEIKDNCIEISIKELQHTRTEIYDDFVIVAHKPGKYKVVCEILCDEYEKRKKQYIDIEVI